MKIKVCVQFVVSPLLCYQHSTAQVFGVKVNFQIISWQCSIVFNIIYEKDSYTPQAGWLIHNQYDLCGGSRQLET